MTSVPSISRVLVFRRMCPMRECDAVAGGGEVVCEGIRFPSVNSNPEHSISLYAFKMTFASYFLLTAPSVAGIHGAKHDEKSVTTRVHCSPVACRNDSLAGQYLHHVGMWCLPV